MLRLRSRCRSTVGRVVRSLSRSLNRAASIGPYDPPARRYKRFGKGSIINWPTGNMYGERWISIGDDTMIAGQVTLSAGMMPGQQMMTDPVVIIGDRCLIGRGSAIVGHYRIDIGDDGHIGGEGLGDGHQVNIPRIAATVMSNGFDFLLKPHQIGGDVHHSH